MPRRILTLAALAASCALGVFWLQQHTGRTGPEQSPNFGAVGSEAPRLLAGARVSPTSLRATSDSLRAREAEAETFGRFDAWAAAFLAQTDPAARRASLPAGLAAASARREVLRDLIAADPARALAHAVPWALRQGLPPEILPFIEDRVDGVGVYHALAAIAPSDSLAGDVSSPVPGPQVATRREVTLGDRTYETFAYGRRLELGSRARLAVHGIAIDGRLALLDSPVRALDPGEPIPAGRRIDETCAVSGLPTTAASPVTADTGDRAIHLCSAGHISVLAAHLQSAEEGAGDEAGTDGPADTSDSAGTLGSVQGTRRVLMIRVRFADQPASFEPESDASAAAMFAATEAFYQANSFGALRIDGTVSPVYTLPQTAAWYSANDSSRYALNILLAARAIAADPASAPGNQGLPALNYLDFDLEAVRYTGGPGTFSGQGYVAMRGCWIKSPDAGVLIHELGHNLGLWHANAWSPADPRAPLGAGSNGEYGDTFDTMGPARGGSWHFNTWEKRRLGWLARAEIATASTSTILTLAAHDLAAPLASGGIAALRIPRDADRDYWIEFRRHPDWLATRPGVHDGVTLRWDPWARSNGGTQLLDTTPGTPAGRDDATLAFGRTFSDTAAGIHVTPLGVNAADPASVDVAVHIGDFAANRKPAVTAAASAHEAAAGQVIQFTASATDPDGDPLSYTWTFDETGTTVPGAAVSRAWFASGDYRARVTVTDRRGGTASASVIVRIGSPVGARLTGRVVDLAGRPVAGALVHNGTEPGADAYRAAWSDSDGTFTLLDVPPGIWQLDASAPGWIFALQGFSHPVSMPRDTGDVVILGCWKGFAVSGAVRRADGSALPGAMVRLGDLVEPTDQYGEFLLTGLSPGRHVITVESTAAAFAPRSIEVGLGDTESIYLAEQTYSVSGTVVGDSLAGVTVTTGWQSTAVVPTGVTGSFSLSGVPAGTWALRAVAPATTFSPDGFSPPVTIAADTSGLTLAPDASPRYAVSGIVIDRGFGLPGATVSIAGRSTVTDSRGGYWLPGLAAGSHVVSVSALDLTFAPATRTVEIAAAHLAGIDFATDRVNQAPLLAAAPRAIGSLGQPFITLVAPDVTDDDPVDQVRYWWSVIGDAPGGVDLASNGTRAAGETVARFSAPGDYRLRLTAVDRFGAASSADLQLTVTGDFNRPVLLDAARADPAVVGRTLQTHLSVRATCPAGDSRLIYQWSVEPGAPGPVTFSANTSTAASATTASFQVPGNYLLRVIVRGPTGHTVESSVAVRVEHTYESWLYTRLDPAIVADPASRASFSGELADPDGDGTVNLLEYAFGGDPATASTDTRPRTHFVTEGGVEYLAVTFRPNPEAIDLLFEPQVSSDLETWHSGLVFIPGPDADVLTYRDFSPASANSRRFIRVQVATSPAE